MLEKDAIDILMKFLDKKVREAEKEIEEKGILSDENAIPLLLKTQFNHIAHLDMEITALRELMNKRFEQVERRFEQMEKRFERLEKIIFRGLSIGFTIIGFLIILFGFLKF